MKEIAAPSVDSARASTVDFEKRSLGTAEEPSSLSSAAAAATTVAAAASIPGGGTIYLPWSELTPTRGSHPNEGSFGIVVHARWTTRRRDVAVKLLKAAGFDDAGFADAAHALEAEAELLRGAADGGTNPHVVLVHGLTRGVAGGAWRDVLGATRLGTVARPDGSVIGIVMHWEGGGTLAELLYAPGRPPWPAGSMLERVGLLMSVADGLWRLHTPLSGRSYIVHGDLVRASRASTRFRLSLVQEVPTRFSCPWSFVQPPSR
jgi:hypothetical protein